MNSDTDNRIKTESKKLKKILKDIPKDKMGILESLICRCAFMKIALEDMENQINEDGQVIEMSQGKYSIDRAHPLLQNYNSMVKNYSSIVKQLCEHLPNDDKGKVGTDLLNFINKK